MTSTDNLEELLEELKTKVGEHHLAMSEFIIKEVDDILADQSKMIGKGAVECVKKLIEYTPTPEDWKEYKDWLDEQYP